LHKKKPGSRFCDAPLKKRCIAPGTQKSRRGRHAQMLGDPAIEIGQRAGAERLLPGDGLFVATQAAPSGFRVGGLLSSDRAGQRR
jgi:hypothetical protein